MPYPKFYNCMIEVHFYTILRLHIKNVLLSTFNYFYCIFKMFVCILQLLKPVKDGPRFCGAPGQINFFFFIACSKCRCCFSKKKKMSFFYFAQDLDDLKKRKRRVQINRLFNLGTRGIHSYCPLSDAAAHNFRGD